VGDMFNHHASYPSVLARYDPTTSAFTFVALREVPSGQELYVQYGPHDDESLLLSYGFVWREPSNVIYGDGGSGNDEDNGEDDDNDADIEDGFAVDDNPHARCMLMPHDIMSTLSAQDLVWLRENGLHDDGGSGDDYSGISYDSQAQYYLTPEGPSRSLRAVLQLQHATANERKSSLLSIIEGQTVSKPNESLVCTSVHELASARLKILLAEDAMAHDSNGGGLVSAKSVQEEVRKIARSWRSNQALVLRAVLSWADEMLMSLDIACDRPPQEEQGSDTPPMEEPNDEPKSKRSRPT